jgi:Tol biopolymer transport system component
VPIVEGVKRSDGAQTGTAQFSTSDTGSLVYVPGPALGSSAPGDVALVDRKGTVEKLKVPAGSYEALRLSPDGKQLALGVADDRGANIWIYEMSGASSLRQLTFGGRNRAPVWTADGQRIVFQSDREGDLGIFWQLADGTDTAQRLTKPENGTTHSPESWSRTGELFSFSASSGSRFSLGMFSVRDKKATSFSQVHSGFPIDSVFSPDGQWVAYVQYEGARSELLVEPFPSAGAKYLIAKGAIHPLWSPEGNALFYTAPGQFYMVGITTRPSFKFSPPVAVPRPFQALGPAAPRSYDIMPDGRFVGLIPLGENLGLPAQITVVLNWFEELKQRVPLGR